MYANTDIIAEKMCVEQERETDLTEMAFPSWTATDIFLKEGRHLLLPSLSPDSPTQLL